MPIQKNCSRSPVIIRRSRRQHLGELLTRETVSKWNGRGGLQPNGESPGRAVALPDSPFFICLDQRLWFGGVVLLGLVPDSDACVRQPAKHSLS